MAEPSFQKKTTLDKDLEKVARLEKASRMAGREVGRLGLGLIFLLGVLLVVQLNVGLSHGSLFIVVAAVIGGYMALNIGANDVANNMAPAVGSRALTMTGALIIAAIFEAGGALLAGGDVVSTVSKSIIDISAVGDADTFILAMMSALLAAALWVNLATYVGAPVSTTHAVVGGIMGAGVVAAQWSAVNWLVMAKIAASWVISPLLGGLLAAAILALIKALIIFRQDKIAAARRWVPLFVAVMAAAFSAYLMIKGFKRIWRPDGLTIAVLSLVAFVVAFALTKPVVVRAARSLGNRRKDVGKLFVAPLICSAALLSFAHGANDVANAIGPLAAIVSAVSTGGVAAKVSVPVWVMLVGAVGIASGLALFGPKLVRMVGEKITRLDPVRAYAVALAAALTVIVASGLGLPVSSTHIAVGAIFGVGFLRELIAGRPHLLSFAAGFNDGGPKKARKRRLVRRKYIFTIIAAWLITVPLAAVLGGVCYLALATVFYG